MYSMHRRFHRLASKLITFKESLSKPKKIAALTVGAGSLIYTATTPLSLKYSENSLSTQLGGIGRFIR